MSEENNEPFPVLQSWKEIAAYLGCDERTCQRWEKKLGLPIRRIGESARSRIFARRDDLDVWLNARLDKNEITENLERFKRPDPAQPASEVKAVCETHARPRSRRRWPLFMGGGLAAIAAAFLAFQPFEGRIPADYRVEGTVLVILDIKGRDLWRFQTTLVDPMTTPLLGPNSNTRIIDKDGMNSLPRLLIRDITGDGRPEVLFYPTDDSGRPAGGLHCFNARGRRLWSYNPGRAIIFGSHKYGSEYYGRFETLDLDGDGRHKILLISNPRGFFPTVASLLDAEGRLLGEYWNSGHIQDVAAADIDGDGRNEIILGAMNNEYRTGVLIALDPEDMGGASPQQNPHYTNPELGQGKEKLYIRFPRNAIDDALARAAAVQFFSIQPSDGILVANFTPSLVQYHLNIGLNHFSPRISHGFEQIYADLYSQGRITEPFDKEALRSKLGEDILWWDGEGWSREPTPAKYRGDKPAPKPAITQPEI